MTIEYQLPRLGRLRAFEQVAAAGTMSAAADQLHLTPPAVSHALRELERELKAPVLERSRAGSFLTREGHILARRTRRFFQQLSEAVAEAVALDAQSDAVARLSRKIGDIHIHSLIAIGRSGSFRRAARMLDVAEPSLHRPARELERLLKTPLYVRTSTGLALSPTGVELARRFGLAAIEIRAAMEEISVHRGASITSMTVGVLALAPKRLLALAAQETLRSHPNARLAFREGAYEDLISAMRNGSIDLIFGSLLLPPPFADVHEEPLFEDPYRIVCRRGHPLTRMDRPRRSDLRNYDWIFPTADLPRRAILDKLIHEWNLSPHVRIETNSLGMVMSTLARSDHISLLPRHYVLIEKPSVQLAVVDVRVPHRRRVVGITSRREWLPTAFQSDFASCLDKLSRRGAGVRR